MGVDYSSWARLYAESRPPYPASLFEFLSGLCARRECAWDCATGNGQAAVALAQHFARVVATDQSAGQLAQALPHPRIEYRVAPAERSELPPASMDLVTVATAVHWFDLETFYRELQRVLRPQGVAAVWAYHVAHVEGLCGEVIWEFYRNVVSPYFSSGGHLVDERYSGIHLPGTPVPTPEFWMEASWSRKDIRAFVTGWSGTQAYMKKHGRDPCDAFEESLAGVFPDEHRRHPLRWPVYLRVSRLSGP